jgi:hypothetical protein
MDEPCVKKWGPQRQAKVPILKVMPIPDNARVAPEDRLLYQYVFTDEFRKSTVGPLVHDILRRLSVGGYVTSVRLRDAVLYTAAVKLGIQSDREHHFGRDLLAIPFQRYRRDDDDDERDFHFLFCLMLEIDQTLKPSVVHFNHVPFRSELTVDDCSSSLSEGVYPIAFFADNVQGFWVLLSRLVLNGLEYQFG